MSVEKIHFQQQIGFWVFFPKYNHTKLRNLLDHNFCEILKPSAASVNSDAASDWFTVQIFACTWKLCNTFVYFSLAHTDIFHGPFTFLLACNTWLIHLYHLQSELISSWHLKFSNHPLWQYYTDPLEMSAQVIFIRFCLWKTDILKRQITNLQEHVWNEAWDKFIVNRLSKYSTKTGLSLLGNTSSIKKV